MSMSRRMRGFLLTTVIMVCGGARAAYPTPGGSDQQIQVHPSPMLDPYQVVENFSAENPGDDYSVVADPRTRAVVAVGPTRVHRQLQAFIREQTAAKMRRFVVDLQISKKIGGQEQVVGEPRLEVPDGERAQLNFDGAWGPGGPDWKSGLEVSPRLTEGGAIRVELGAVRGKTRTEVPARVDLRPGQEILIDPTVTEDPLLRKIGEVLNQDREGPAYSVRLQVRPL